ncbi:MAG: hypothetical protein COC19_04140, partial [SAR86 cluster bacterium]
MGGRLGPLTIVLLGMLMRLPLDLLYNIRLLRKNIGFVVICVLMIGSGIALCIGLYTIGDNLGTKAMPFPNGDKFLRVMAVDESTSSGNTRSLDPYLFEKLKESAQSFQTFGAEQDFTASFSDGDVATRYFADRLSPEILQATGVVPILGRNLLPSDDSAQAPAVVVISHALWQNYYIGRDDIIGIDSRINGSTYTVVGVMPEGFAYPIFHHAWLPLKLENNPEPGGQSGITVTAVLKQGVNVETARAEIDSLLQQQGERLPEYYGQLGGRLSQCCSMVDGDSSVINTLFSTLSIALLLLVSLNVANLILVRTNQRLHEFSIRSALGASRRQLIIAILQDSLLICLLGALLGIVLADLGLAYINSAVTVAISSFGELPFWFNFDWELSTIIMTLLMVLAIWLLSAGLAIWKILRQDLAITLAGGKSGATDNRNGFGTATMVSIEIIFSFFLLVFCGVLVGTSLDLADTKYGTSTEGYLTGQVFLDTDSYDNPAARELYRSNLHRELVGLEGIEKISFTSDLPSLSRIRRAYDLEDFDVRIDNEYPRQRIIQIAQNYFDTMDVPLRAGRIFESTDVIDSEQVVIIDEVFAKKIWPDAEDPNQMALGKRIRLSPEAEAEKWLTIVGVTAQILQAYALEGSSESAFFLPYSQPCCIGSSWQPISIVLKVTGDPYDFERKCAELLKKYGWDAITTKKSGDQGADIIAIKNGKSVAIQCKLHSKPVGNKAVQEALSGKLFNSVGYAAVVASNGFTYSAKQLAQKTDV